MQENLVCGQSSNNEKRESPTVNLQGNKIVYLSHFGKSLQRVIDHASDCLSGGKPSMDQEIECKGLGCVIQLRCVGCGMTNLAKVYKGPSGHMRHCINIAAVWGFMSTGSGYANMKEVFSALNIPSPDEKTFLKAFTVEMIEARKAHC